MTDPDQVWQEAFAEWAMQPGDKHAGNDAAAEVISAYAQSAADERQAAIVAWLKEQYSGKLQSAVYLADAIDRGEWKGQG